MRRAWVVLLASCGFKGPIANQLDPDADPSAICWRIVDSAFGFTASACVATLDERIDVTTNISLDTVGINANPLGLTCATLLSGSDDICLLAASSIRIA